MSRPSVKSVAKNSGSAFPIPSQPRFPSVGLSARVASPESKLKQGGLSGMPTPHTEGVRHQAYPVIRGRQVPGRAAIWLLAGSGFVCLVWPLCDVLGVGSDTHARTHARPHDDQKYARSAARNHRSAFLLPFVRHASFRLVNAWACDESRDSRGPSPHGPLEAARALSDPESSCGSKGLPFRLSLQTSTLARVLLLHLERPSPLESLPIDLSAGLASSPVLPFQHGFRALRSHLCAHPGGTPICRARYSSGFLTPLKMLPGPTSRSSISGSPTSSYLQRHQHHLHRARHLGGTQGSAR